MNLEYLIEIVEKAKPGMRFGCADKVRNIDSTEIANVVAYQIVNAGHYRKLTSLASTIGRSICKRHIPYTNDISHNKDMTLLGLSIIRQLRLDRKCKLIKKTEEKKDKETGEIKPVMVRVRKDLFVPKKVWTISFDSKDTEELFNSITVDAVRFNIVNNPPAIRKRFFTKEQGSLVTKLPKEYAKHFTAKKIPMIYDHINELQQTPLSVNTDVLTIIEEMLKRKEAVLTFSNKKNVDNEILEGLRRDRDMTLIIANEFKNSDYYTYWGLDTRGRYYDRAPYLSIQGSKLAKSMIKLSNKLAQPLKQEGYFWLCVHLANCIGFDKLPIDDRFNIVNDNIQFVLELFRKPLDHTWWWTNVDDCFGTLAASRELLNAFDSGDHFSYKSSLMVGFDATTSGLMIFSALSKDEVTGKLCNLTKCDDIGDSYLYIADKVWDTLPTNDFWQQYKSKRRKIVKRSVMTYLYSCGAASMGEHIWNDFKTSLDISQKQCDKLGKLIYNACKNHLPGPASIMKLFIKGAGDLAKEGKQVKLKGIENDFPFQQYYTIDQTDQIRFKINDRILKPRYISKYGTSPDKSKISTATAPNIIHHLDSQLVARIMNIKNYPILLVHDCFFTIPSTAGKLYEDCRTAFHDLFFVDDVLNNICKNLNTEDTIKRGNLNTDHIFDNEYCFS